MKAIKTLKVIKSVTLMFHALRRLSESSLAMFVIVSYLISSQAQNKETRHFGAIVKKNVLVCEVYFQCQFGHLKLDRSPMPGVCPVGTIFTFGFDSNICFEYLHKLSGIGSVRNLDFCLRMV